MIVRRIFSYIVGLIFISSGISKLFIFNQFIHSVATYKLIHPRIIPLSTCLLIGLEIIIGGLLVFQKKIAALGASMLLLGFIFLSIYSKVKGIEANCDCFSFLKMKITSLFHFIFIIVLFITSIFIFDFENYSTINIDD